MHLTTIKNNYRLQFLNHLGIKNDEGLGLALLQSQGSALIPTGRAGIQSPTGVSKPHSGFSRFGGVMLGLLCLHLHGDWGTALCAGGAAFYTV